MLTFLDKISYALLLWCETNYDFFTKIFTNFRGSFIQLLFTRLYYGQNLYRQRQKSLKIGKRILTLCYALHSTVALTKKGKRRAFQIGEMTVEPFFTFVM